MNKIEQLKELELKLKYDKRVLLVDFIGSTSFISIMLPHIKNLISNNNNDIIYFGFVISLIYAFQFDIKLDSYKLSISEKNILKLEIDNDSIKNY